MKVYLSILPALLGLCLCDQDTSSYAILPYGNEILPLPPQHPQDNSFNNYYDSYDEKKKFNFGRIMRAPLRALKGAGNYMKGMFDDVRSKFLELNGSFLKARGDLFKSGSENFLKQAYKTKPKKNFYDAAQTFYAPYQSQSGSKYNQNPKPIYPYKVSEEEEADQNSINGLGLKDSEYTDVSNSIDGVADDSEFSRRKNEFSSNSFKKFKNFTPSDRDFTLRNKERGRNFFAKNAERRQPYPLTRNRQREYIQQRSATADTQRAQRSYHVVSGGYDFGKPIPVPVPIAINPAQLVFPSVQDLNPVIGY